jgi:hypothetical protein
MADYDISNVPRRVVYAASGTGPYAFTFEILVQTDIAVYQNTTLLTLTTDYTVSINTNGTGSITLTASPTGSTITIVGDRAIERTTDFTTGGDLFANVLNDELDSLTIFDQQNAEAITRAIRAPETDPTTIDMVLPSATSRANKVLSFDANGDPEAVNTITDLNDVAGIVNEIVELSGVSQAIEDLDAIKDDIETVSGLAADIAALALKTTQIGVIGDDLASTGWSFDLGSVADATTGQTGVPDGYLVTVYDNLTDITTVATDIANVNAVGGSIANVNAVAAELGTGGDVTVVSADLSGTDTIGTVATNIANVNAVGGSIANVNSVAAELGTGGDVTVVSADLTGTDTIGTVAGIAANVTTVAGISGNVTTVAGISANVTTVAGISSDVSTVSTNNANVTTVATNIAAINTNATNIVAIQNASTNATNAANSATAAGNAQTAAEAARDATLLAYDNFDDRYLGSKTSNPTLDNDGNALVGGALYFNSVAGEMRVYTGSAWVAAYVSGTGFLSASNNLSDVASVSTARTNLGLGTIATQAASNVSITGGSISGITDLAIADGGTGGSTAADARTNLGLGSIATQASSSVSITGGFITGITDLAVADGGTGASTAAGARASLLPAFATNGGKYVRVNSGETDIEYVTLDADPAGTAVALAIALG